MKYDKLFGPKSLILRLVIPVGLSAILILVGFGLYIEHTAKEHFMRMDIYELDLVSRAAKESLRRARSEELLQNALDQIILSHPNLFIYLEDKSGKIPYISERDDGDLLALIVKNRFGQNETLQTWNDGKNYYRVLMNPVENANIAKIAVGIDINFHRSYIIHFRATLRFVTTMACLVALAACFLVIFFGFKPVKTISRKIQNITTERLNIRLDEKSAPIELRSLVLSFNKMIEHIEDVFERQSNFSADIAHELRTPISSLMTQIQIALSLTRSAKEYQEILYSSLEELKRMSRMVNDMLFLATCETEAIVKEEVDLADEVANITEYFSVLAEESGVTIDAQSEAFKIIGNKEMIRRAIANLISNAIYYAQPNSVISITFLKDKKTMQISNKTRTVLSKENTDRLFDRFYRTGAARDRKSGGSGIGLAIVKSIIKAHQADISATYEDGVITFTVKFLG